MNKPTGVKIGQIQWLLFWAFVFNVPHIGFVWFISMFFEDKEL